MLVREMSRSSSSESSMMHTVLVEADLLLFRCYSASTSESSSIQMSITARHEAVLATEVSAVAAPDAANDVHACSWLCSAYASLTNDTFETCWTAELERGCWTSQHALQFWNGIRRSWRYGRASFTHAKAVVAFRRYERQAWDGTGELFNRDRC